jgi:hypothetical protein
LPYFFASVLAFSSPSRRVQSVCLHRPIGVARPAARALLPPTHRSFCSLPLAGEGRDGGSTSRTPSRQNARTEVVAYRAIARYPKNRSASEARSSNPATPGNPVPSSAPLDRRRAGASRRVEEAVTL